MNVFPWINRWNLFFLPFRQWQFLHRVSRLLLRPPRGLQFPRIRGLGHIAGEDGESDSFQRISGAIAMSTQCNQLLSILHLRLSEHKSPLLRARFSLISCLTITEKLHHLHVKCLPLLFGLNCFKYADEPGPLAVEVLLRLYHLTHTSHSPEHDNGKSLRESSVFFPLKSNIFCVVV